MKKIKSILDLKPKYEEFTIANPESGEEFTIALRPLTHREVTELNLSVKRPKPKEIGFKPYKDEFGRPVPIYNTDDPAYLKEVAEANRDLVFSWLIASADLEVPGETVEEKKQALGENVPNWVFLAVEQKLNEVQGYSQSDVAYQKKKLATTPTATANTNSVNDGASG